MSISYRLYFVCAYQPRFMLLRRSGPHTKKNTVHWKKSKRKIQRNRNIQRNICTQATINCFYMWLHLILAILHSEYLCITKRNLADIQPFTMYFHNLFWCAIHLRFSVYIRSIRTHTNPYCDWKLCWYCLCDGCSCLQIHMHAVSDWI